MESAGSAPRALAIVPARLASSRLPSKMLLAETGRFLFQHTVENARRAAGHSAPMVRRYAQIFRSTVGSSSLPSSTSDDEDSVRTAMPSARRMSR